MANRVESKVSKKPLCFSTPVAPTVFTIIAAALVVAGFTLLLALLRPSPFTELVKEVSQVVPINGMNTYGTRGIRVPLPAPSETVNELVRDGWTLDLPDNNDHPVGCRHKVVVNGVALKGCSNHAQIAESLRGACSIWGVGTDATVHMSLPESADRIDSMTVQWHLAQKSGLLRTEQEEQRRNQLGFVGVSMCCTGSFGIALLQMLRRKNWATWLLAVAAGSAAGLPMGCWLLGSTDAAVGQWLSTCLTTGISVICIVTLGLGLLLAMSVRWCNPLCGVSAPSISIVVLTLGVSVASLESGWVSSKMPASPYDNNGPVSVLFDGRIPFSDALGWYTGMSAVNNGQPVQWAARRPVHALIRSGEFEFARGNYQWSLLIQAAIFSLAVAALTISAWRAVTPAVALIIWVGAFRVGQGFLCSYLTESVGYSCACLSLAYLLAGCKDNRFGVRLAGIAWLGMAWLTRPGPLALLAVPIALEALVPTARRFRRTALAVTVMACVLLGGKAMFYLVAAKGATENANAAPTIYGLAIGERWDAAYKDFYAASPERAKLGLPEQTAMMYSEAWKKFVSNPTPAYHMALTNLRNGFNNSVISLPGMLWTSLIAMLAPWQLPEKAVAWTLLLGGTATAFVMVKRKRLVVLLLSGFVIGMITSLPIIWGDGGLRGVIIATPSLLVFLSLLCAVPEELYGRQSNIEPQRTCIGISHAGSAATLVALVTGATVYMLRQSPTVAPATPMTISIGRDPAVFISDQTATSQMYGAAMLTSTDAVRSMQDRGMAVYKLDEFLESITPDKLIVLKFHSETSSQMLVIENPGSPRTGELVVEATAPSKNPYFIRATKWHWIDQ